MHSGEIERLLKAARASRHHFREYAPLRRTYWRGLRIREAIYTP